MTVERGGRFALDPGRLDPGALAETLRNGGSGAFAAFEGRVRSENGGRAVRALEYEAYEALALAEGEGILAEALGRYEIVDARCVHRVGSLGVGEVAVWIGVVAAHRGPAFDACRFIIDAVKSRVPIWKKERYVDGSAEWTRG